jgi:hypothetical protein
VPPQKYRIDSTDVAVNRSWLRASGRSGNIARTSRAEGTQTGYLELIHRPTKLSVKGVVPAGSYSRKAMKAEMDSLHVSLFAELERAVAQHLRLPGR